VCIISSPRVTGRFAALLLFFLDLRGDVLCEAFCVFITAVFLFCPALCRVVVVVVVVVVVEYLEIPSRASVEHSGGLRAALVARRWNIHASAT